MRTISIPGEHTIGNWFLTLLALVISRAYCLLYIQIGTRKAISACDLVRLLWLDLGGPIPRESGQ